MCVLLYFSGFVLGLSLSNIKEHYYSNAIIKKLNSSNQKYKKYIIHKNLLEDWHVYNANINNDELPSKQID
jgi:hypothetical protein